MELATISSKNWLIDSKVYVLNALEQAAMYYQERVIARVHGIVSRGNLWQWLFYIYMYGLVNLAAKGLDYYSIYSEEMFKKSKKKTQMQM